MRGILGFVLEKRLLLQRAPMLGYPFAFSFEDLCFIAFGSNLFAVPLVARQHLRPIG